jgi:hypothetical protein
LLARSATFPASVLNASARRFETCNATSVLSAPSRACHSSPRPGAIRPR